ncbi:uncharacterized protein LOC117178877 [Belonocnema kinseyi]|uniref:uncharacterized protein LOC117178877 n=1 Tax=Belonocnema kinseyi TaxID=2817044 RepID=UPI00143DAD28|nr:uncharacterized protein LOC117178877 [Belonocnema kinseyi]
MKIASCILILTFSVYLGFIGCSSPIPGPSNFGPTHWMTVHTDGHRVRVKRDFWSGKVLAVELQGQLPFRAIPGEIRHVVDRANNLHFAAQVNPETGKWIAVDLIKPAYNLILPPLPPIKPRDRPENNEDV